MRSTHILNKVTIRYPSLDAGALSRDGTAFIRVYTTNGAGHESESHRINMLADDSSEALIDSLLQLHERAKSDYMQQAKEHRDKAIAELTATHNALKGQT